jgi:hypothetical protein
MSHHRLEDRARAHERNGRLANAWTDALEKAMSKLQAATRALPPAEELQ